MEKLIEKAKTLIPGEYANMMEFKVRVTYLPKGTFDNYTALRQAQGADLAHIKPPHINPPDSVLSALLGEAEETIIVTRTGDTVQGMSTPVKTGQKIVL